MYFNILKKDFKRKKTMNVILLIFVILAATFIASSMNNLITVSSALDNYFQKAKVPDHWIVAASKDDIKGFEEFAEENGYDYHISRLIQIDPKNVLVDGEKMEYTNTVAISTLGGIKIFDKNDSEITLINDGEIYIPYIIFQSSENDYHVGGKIGIKQGGAEKEFTIKGYTKDALFGSATVGMTRFLVSENDAKLFDNTISPAMVSVEVYTKDVDFKDKINSLGIDLIFSADYSMAKKMYMMDTLIAAILLIVSICLILISMVVLRFIINFTITEEFREIGVMKAIGIKNGVIRRLYIVKYLAISVIGTAIGLLLSIPFGRIMISGVSHKIIISGEDNFFVNIFSAVLAGAVVILFSYFCTRKICRFSPIDAIHNGETGERFKKKGIFRLERSHLPTSLFMVVNDIFSGIKSYVSMIIIFILGTLLVILPINTINTLRSDDIITMFNMTRSDHIVAAELLFSQNEDNKAKIEKQFSEIHDMFAESGIDVDVFQEIVFRSYVKKGEKLTNSISFIGMGGVKTDDYVYLDGSAPQNVNEVALTYLVADRIDAKIGDNVEIKVGGDEKTYIVTGITQSMNNMGDGVRFYQNEQLDFKYASGSFGVQVNYKDNPDAKAVKERKAMLERLYPNAKVYTSGEYINYMIGDIASQLDSIKLLILSIVLGINMLVAVLMVKSFITKEKGEIALLKAIGFKNNSLILWQTMRIGIVLLVSVITGALVSVPLSSPIITPAFRMMGAYSIKYEIRPLEVYVIFPLIVLAATALAAFISAQGLRKIASSEISGNE